jgi:unsaturated chondroitin disaccharide hydrolase
MRAARRLWGRYKPEGGFIQAWGDLKDPASYRLIIDCLMNLPLLFWAGEELGDHSGYINAARRHLESTLATIVRPDASTYHTYFFDPATGAPSHGITRQGFSDSSCWARGQAWGVYGIPLSRRHVQIDAMSEVHDRITDYFLARLPEDGVCYWDLIFTSGEQERDSSAAAIFVCGLLEALPGVEDPERRGRYERAIQSIMQALMTRYAANDREDGLLSHAVYSKPHNAGIDECCIWGDYFYLEALRRLKGHWEPYW